MKSQKIRFSAHFKKSFHKSPLKIRHNFETRLNIFLENPQHPILNNHHLTGNLKGYYSLNITGDWRAVYSFQIIDSENIIVFEMIGTHSQLYG